MIDSYSAATVAVVEEMERRLVGRGSEAAAVVEQLALLIDSRAAVAAVAGEHA